MRGCAVIIGGINTASVVVNREPLKTEGMYKSTGDVSTYHLVGPNYFYFFTIVMCLMGVIFIFVAKKVKEKTYVRSDA